MANIRKFFIGSAACGSLKCLKGLIDLKADVSGGPSAGTRPLTMAIVQDRVECMKILISSGAELEFETGNSPNFFLDRPNQLFKTRKTGYSKLPADATAALGMVVEGCLSFFTLSTFSIFTPGLRCVLLLLSCCGFCIGFLFI